jgi:hypothetical protein
MQPCATPDSKVAVVERDKILSTGAESIKALVSEEREYYPGSKA